MSDRYTISQCMIVKNEEENIIRALFWGKEFFDEQIVVDTGSIDKTVELAEEMGAIVYRFEWINDFAAAKNFAISKAKGDWIAFLDADEYIKQEDVGKIVPLIKEAEKAGVYTIKTLMLNIDKKENVTGVIRQVRFFKNVKELRYQGRIHEHLELTNGKKLEQYQIDSSDITIYHTGYDPDIVKEKKKYERNLQLLLKELELQPENYHTMGDLGDLYLSMKTEGNSEEFKQKAEYWYREAVKRVPRVALAQHDRNVKSFLMLMQILYRKKDETELIKIYQDIIKRFEGIYDADYIMGKFYIENRGDYQKGIYHLERAIAILDQYGTKNYGPMMLQDLGGVWELLAYCYYEIGDKKNCLIRCVNLLKADNKRITALELLLKTLASEKIESIIQFLGKLYNYNDINDKNIIFQACQNAEFLGVWNEVSRY